MPPRTPHTNHERGRRRRGPTDTTWHVRVRRGSVTTVTPSITPTPADRISAIRIRARTADDAIVAAHARDDLCELTGALGDVRALHRPRDGSRRCPQCSHGRRRGRWPYATRLAIARALGVEEAT